MPTPYPKGSIITLESNKYKVLEELGDLRFISAFNKDENWETTSNSFIYHFKELEREGWKVEGERWEPKKKEYYWTVGLGARGCFIQMDVWIGSDYNQKLLEHNLIFQTYKQAEEKYNKINEILRGK